MKFLMGLLLLASLVACAPRTVATNVRSGLCPEVGTVETRKPALVSIFVKVKTCSGAALTDLTIEDFSILEDDASISNSESQPDIFPSEQSYRSNTVLLLDLSGSIVKTGALVELKDAAKRFVETLFEANDVAHLALYWFDGSAAIYQLADFSSDKTDLIQKIDLLTESTPSDDSTNLNGAVLSGLEALAQEDKRLREEAINFTLSSLVIFTDGTDRASRVTETKSLEAVRAAGSNVLIQTVGLGDEINPSNLSQVGRDGFESAQNTDQIALAFERAAERISLESKSFYLVRYCSPRRAGSHDLTVQIDNNGQRGAFQQAFSAEGFEAGCDPSDASGSLLAQRSPQLTAASTTSAATNTTAETTTTLSEAFDVVCVKNETRWDISYSNKWGADETWYEASVKARSSNVHPWPLSAGQASPSFFVRFDSDFSEQLNYQEYSLSKYPSQEQSCANAKTYVFKQLEGQEQIGLFAIN